MSPIDFPESNTRFGPPPDLADSQCQTIHAFIGQVNRGSLDGAALVVTAWKPTPEEIEAISKGAPIYLSCLGGLPPHLLTVNFEQAITVA
jgi:hypothetical protein